MNLTHSTLFVCEHRSDKRPWCPAVLRHMLAVGWAALLLIRPCAGAAASADPVWVGNWPGLSPGRVESVAIQGNYAYLAMYDAGLAVIDVTDPARPRQVGGYNSGWYPVAVTVSGQYAYLANSFHSLDVIDVSDPANPHRVAAFGTNAPSDYFGFWSVAIAGHYAYLGGTRSSMPGFIDQLEVIDVTDPVNPMRVGGHETSGVALGVTVSGRYAYVGAGAAGLEVFDISDPAAVQRVGRYDTYDRAESAALSGDYAYLVNGPSGLQVIKVADPADPQRVGGYLPPAGVSGVTVVGHSAYVTVGTDGLEVLDISDPANPQRVGGHDTSGVAIDVAVSGNHVFVADGSAGLQIFYHATEVRLETVGLNESAFRMRVSGPVGVDAQVQSSADLVNWENLGAPVTLGTEPVRVSDPEATQHARRFYRARKL